MRDLTHRSKESRYFLKKTRHFFRFSRRSRRGLVSTLEKCSEKVAVMQNVVLHCRYFVPAIKIFGKFVLAHFIKVAASNFIYLTVCNFTETPAF